jgi:hypothetical protein
MDGGISMPLLEWVKAVQMPLAGTPYEPWVQLLQFIFWVSVMLSAITWVLTRRHVITVAYWVWSLAIQANNALKHAWRYAPATERHLARLEPYIALVFFGYMGIVETLCMLLAIGCLYLVIWGGMWWWGVVTAFFYAWFLVRSRLNWVAMSWAWHSITTGEEFTWPRRRASLPPAP